MNRIVLYVRQGNIKIKFQFNLIVILIFYFTILCEKRIHFSLYIYVWMISIDFNAYDSYNSHWNEKMKCNIQLFNIFTIVRNMNFLCSISIWFNVSHTINQSKRRSLYNICFNMIIQDKKNGKESNAQRKGFLLKG